MPDSTIVPIKDGEDAHEAWPARARLSERLQVLGPRIAPAISHNNGFDSLLIDQASDFALEVSRVELDTDAIPRIFSKQKIINTCNRVG